MCIRDSCCTVVFKANCSKGVRCSSQWSNDQRSILQARFWVSLMYLPRKGSQVELTNAVGTFSTAKQYFPQVGKQLSTSSAPSDNFSADSPVAGSPTKRAASP